MTTITVRDVFYSRVEASFSPRNRNGYQVFYHSPGLASDLVREVGGYQRCFEAQEVSIRYQYFALSSGDVVISASRELPSISSVITDRAGREGVFLSHSLVISIEDFAAIDFNPFAIIDADDAFILEIEAAIELQKNPVSARSIELSETFANEADYYSFPIVGWTKEQFANLWQSAAHAQTMLTNQLGIAVQAESEDEILSLLRLIIEHLPPEMRRACTFNSFIDGCEPVGGVFWAVGGIRKPRMANALRVRLDRKQAEAPPYLASSDIETLANDIYKELRIAQNLDEQ